MTEPQVGDIFEYDWKDYINPEYVTQRFQHYLIIGLDYCNEPNKRYDTLCLENGKVIDMWLGPAHNGLWRKVA